MRLISRNNENAATLSYARTKGRIGGRKPKFTDEHWDSFGQEILAGRSHREVAQQFGVGVSTLYKKFPSTTSHHESSTSV